MKRAFLICFAVSCSAPNRSQASASATASLASASPPALSASAEVALPRAASRLLAPLDVQHFRAWAREADERIPDDGLVTSPPARGDHTWVSWPLPIAALPRRVLAVITCRYATPTDGDAAHAHGPCRVWTVDFGSHEWASAPLDLPTKPRDLGTIAPLDPDVEREIGFLMSDVGTAFLDTLGGWPPASRGWDSTRANAHRLGELLARSLSSEMMRLYWEVDGRFFRWVELAAELDVMGRGGRFRPCAKRAPTTFDRDGIAPGPIALSVPTRRDGCLRLTRPIMADAAGDGPPLSILPPRFVVDIDPDSLAVTSMTAPETWLHPMPVPFTTPKHELPDVEARIASELPRVVSLFIRRGPLSGDERDFVVAYEADFFTLVDRNGESVYRAIAPDFFRWLDEVRSGARSPL